MGTYVSLFAGIGGLDLAVESLGYTCVGQVEWDAACNRVLERWWPSVPRWGDIHEFTAAAYADRSGRGEHGRAISVRASLGSAQRPDLIIGGYPCQPFSHAGKRGGTEDPRHIWPEFARIAGELRPRWLLLENVPGHLSLGGHDVLADLTALGYDAIWTTVRAADVGAPHRRERWFCLATDTDNPRSQGPGPARRRIVSDTGVGSSAPVGQLTRSSPAGDGLPEPAEHGPFPWGAYEPAIRRWERVMGPAPHPVDDKGRLAPPFVEWMQGFPPGWTDGMSRTQALKALGNAVVPQQASLAMEVLS